LLAKELIPGKGTLDQLISLLRATSPICNLESPEHEKCPLCRRELGHSEVVLLKRYHELLTGKLEQEIVGLRADLQKAPELVEAAHEVNREEWDKSATLPADLFEQAKTGSEVVLKSCELANEPADKAKEALKTLRAVISRGAQLLEQKAKAIEIATRGRGELIQALAQLRTEIEPLEYADAIASYLLPLKAVNKRAAEAEFWGSTLPVFTPLLKKITDTAKETHQRLIVSDFEARLNAEYKALSEKPMGAFGVTLENRGSEGLVTLLPQVGDEGRINRILSEGEQRLHALALFFAELETCPQSVIVFDDPVSSFDYNFIANYCARLRDFAVTHPERQIVVLTHNWEFFVQLQLTFNKSGLNNDLSVQVLENCAVVADYSEKVHELKTDITRVLTTPGEPLRAAKEELAAKMRRLIESVVNTHVFNNQRHQFKQKSLPVTDFPHFTKITPLLSTEATTLGDLYAKLSITEHDDPRNAYVNTDKATFQSRYDTILGIETAVVSRKQP
jgi:DNA repair exonuclease SbcCD ATPase subunit